MILSEADKVFLATWLMEVGTTQGMTHGDLLDRKYHATANAYYHSPCHMIEHFTEAGYMHKQGNKFYLAQKALDELGGHNANA